MDVDPPASPSKLLKSVRRQARELLETASESDMDNNPLTWVEYVECIDKDVLTTPAQVGKSASGRAIWLGSVCDRSEWRELVWLWYSIKVRPLPLIIIIAEIMLGDP